MCEGVQASKHIPLFLKSETARKRSCLFSSPLHVSCSMRRVHIALKTTSSRGRLRNWLHFLSGNVCVCDAQTNGQRVPCFQWEETREERREEEERHSQQGPLAVWDWDRRTCRFWPWGRPLNPRETERTEAREQTATGVIRFLCSLPLEMTQLLSTGAKWYLEDNKG